MNINSKKKFGEDMICYTLTAKQGLYQVLINNRVLPVS